MDFGHNISPIEVIKKGAFGGTYFSLKIRQILLYWVMN